MFFNYVEGMRTVGERYLGPRLYDPIFTPPSVSEIGARIEYADSSGSTA
jgi:hypothetical protein